MIARTQPSPPSVVADPPRHTTIFFAPRSSAWSISSPVPVVVAAIASLPSAPPTSVSPEARAISMTAVPRWRRHSACTGSPSGPVTVLVRFGAAERLQRALATVGDRQLDALVAELPAGVADRRGDLRGGGRALELVDRGEHSHRVQARAARGALPNPDPLGRFPLVCAWL